MTAEPSSGAVIQASGDLFAKVPGVQSSKGVALNPPPAEILGTVNGMVAEAVKNLPEGSTGALVGIATKAKDGTVNVNLAVTKKVNDRVTVLSWLGKSWGSPVEGGAAVQIVF